MELAHDDDLGDRTVDEGHLVPALRAQCVLANSNQNVNPQSPDGNSGAGGSATARPTGEREPEARLGLRAGVRTARHPSRPPGPAPPPRSAGMILGARYCPPAMVKWTPSVRRTVTPWIVVV